MKKWIPYIVYFGFLLMNIIAGILLITGLSEPIFYEDPIGFSPLTFLDLLLLIALNIPALIIVSLSIKRNRNQKNDD